MNNQDSEYNYQDEYGITDKVRETVNRIPSHIATMWVKNTLKIAHEANSAGEFSVSFHTEIEGGCVHLDFVEILDIICPDCYWEIHRHSYNSCTRTMKVHFIPGTMVIPIEFR